MSAPMKRHHTDKESHTKKVMNNVIIFRHAGVVYKIPENIAEKYIHEEGDDSGFVMPDKIFSKTNQKYTKPGALLRGLRARENLTQVELADKLHVTQSDISQMENGTRSIGRTIAQRIEKLFDVDYRSFLS
jgi:DNA-binding XRE family transcriptional regulator